MTSKCRRAPTKCDWSSVVYIHLIKQTVHVQVCDGRISTLKNVAKFCLVHSSVTIHVKGLEEKVKWELRWIICILSLYTVTYSVIYLPTSNNQRLRSTGGFFTLLLHRCALRKFHVTDSQNTRDQITSDRRSKRAWSNCVLCIPFILSGSPNECWLHTCDACVTTTWRLGLRAPLCRPQYNNNNLYKT